MVKRIMQWLQTAWCLVTFRGSGLETEVTAALPIIETLESQILDAVEKGTNATDELSASFGGMARQARDVVSMAAGSGQDNSLSGVDQIRTVMGELLAQVRHTSQSTQQMADMLSDIEHDLQAVESCIAQIEDIANRSRMVSLNGQIEAARAQEFGDGFAVVASETGDLAKNVSDSSQQIREVVDRMASSLRSMASQTKELVAADQAATAVCEQRVELMLLNLGEYQAELEANLRSTKNSSDQLAGAISHAVMTLQFQDAVSQRLKHVVGTMGEMRDIFGSLVGPESGAAKRRREEWIEKLMSSYCIDDERAVLTGEAPAADTDSSDTSQVELF